jgi:lipopolysaccharide export system protein LptA
MNFRPSISALFIVLACVSAPTLAEKADREKPINIEADRLSVDDRNKTQTYEGRVRLTQGTILVQAEKIVVTQDAEGFQKGVATGGEGGLARFKQKREGRNDWFEGEAERIEYEGRTDRTQFFQRAWVKNGQDEARGQYIEYNALTENYLVTSGPNATVVPGSRVTATIVPKSDASAPPASKP